MKVVAVCFASAIAHCMVGLKRKIYGLPILRLYRLYRAKRAFGRPRLVPEGFKMVSFSGAFSADWEREERSIITQLLPDCAMLVDIGANHGLYSLLAAHLGKPSLAIEPEEINLTVLRLNAKSRLIQICPVALSDHEGEAYLYGDGYMASLERNWQGVPKHFRQKVEVTKLDKLLENVSGKLLIKMDVEGAEATVLRGAPETLKGNHLWLIESYPTQPSGARCQGFLETFEIMFNAGYEARLASEPDKLFTMEDALTWDRSPALASNFVFYRPVEDASKIMKAIGAS